MVLRIQKVQISDRKEILTKLEDTVNYLQFVASTLDAAKLDKESLNRPPKQQEKAYLGLPIY